MKRRGFTLIELLAVIIILGVIALIAVPVITGILEYSRKESLKTTVTNLSKAVESDCLAIKMRENEYPKIYKIKNGKIDNNLDINGKLPDNGMVIVSVNCKTKIVATDTRYTSVKIGKNITINEKEEGNYIWEDDSIQGRMVYRGANPNNYIFLEDGITGNNLYRIIAFEPDGSIKVVKDQPYKYHTYDAEGIRNVAGTYCGNGGYGGCNAWAKSSMYNNGGIAGAVSEDSQINTFLNQTIYNNMSDKLKYSIVEHNFNIGGVSHALNSGVGPNYKSLVNSESAVKWNGKIGLINPSDFLKATSNPLCDANKNAYSGSISDRAHYKCGQNNFLANPYYSWTMNPLLGNHRNVYTIEFIGAINRAYASNTSLLAMPTFFLDEDINVIGSGTKEEPYKLD